MSERRQLTAQQLKDAYAAGERNFREIEVLRESLYRRANLEGANLIGANLKGANLIGANLDGANLIGATLKGATLEGANLKGANLIGATLEGATLDGANLIGATLDGANLIGATLEGATLDGATLKGATLKGATLDGARHFLSARIPCMSSRGDGELFTGTMYRDRLVVYAGCFKGEGADNNGQGGSPDAFRAQVVKIHGDNIHAQLYLAQLAVFEASWRHWLTTLPAEEPTAAQS